MELKRQDPQTYRHSYPRAYKLGQAAQKSDNVEKFLMGRQMFVVFIVFFSAKLTTIHSESEADFLFPIPDWFRSVFLETGILACVLVVILAQLMPQIVAAHYPVAFLDFSIMKYGYYACIFLEWTGRQTTLSYYIDLPARAITCRNCSHHLGHLPPPGLALWAGVG